MRRAWITGPGQVRVGEANLGPPGPDEVQVATARVGVCGSDVHALHGAHPFIDLPVSPGHEAVGRVIDVGEAVADFAVGERVLLEPNVVCGRCHYCATGRYNLCEHLQVVGCQMDGAMAEAFNVPANRLHHVPAEMSDAQAAMVEPLSTGVHAVRMSGMPADAVVAVLGAGSIGLGTLLAVRGLRPSAVAVTDLSEAKREQARTFGADLVVDPSAPDVVASLRATLPRRPDVIFDCVANEATTRQALQLALKGGTVVVVGVPTAPVTVDWPLIQDREVRVQGSAMYTSADVSGAMQLIHDGAPVERMISAELPLERAAEAFKAAASGAHTKVHVVVRDDE